LQVDIFFCPRFTPPEDRLSPSTLWGSKEVLLQVMERGAANALQQDSKFQQAEESTSWSGSPNQNSILSLM
jgi:hypothetical protein